MAEGSSPRGYPLVLHAGDLVLAAAQAMKLVVDNDSNVKDLPVTNAQDIPENLNVLADDIEAGVWGEVETVIALMVTPDGIASVTYGENGSIYELAGILEAAKLRALADGHDD